MAGTAAIPMQTLIPALSEEHREIEAALDRLAGNLAAGRIELDFLRRINELMVQHFRREEPFYDRLREHEPRFADKLIGQHAESLEILGHLEASVEAGEGITYLTRRLLAIARHNMIEEERDAFPLVKRWFRPQADTTPAHED